MPTLKETAEQLKALVPIVMELAGDVKELDALVKQLQENSDPATIEEMAAVIASMQAELRAAADVVPEVEEPTEPEEPPTEPV